MMVDDATFLVMSHISDQIGLHDATNSAATTSRLELPEPAVRKTIVNAACHHAYSIAASVSVAAIQRSAKPLRYVGGNRFE